MSPGPKIVIEVIIVIILVAWPVHLLILRPLVLNHRLRLLPPGSIALPETILKTKCLFGPISFLLAPISCYYWFNAIVENAWGLAWLQLRLIQQTILDIMALLQKVIVLLAWT